MKANYRKKLSAAASMLTAGMMLLSAGALTGCGNKNSDTGNTGNAGSSSSAQPTEQLTDEQKKAMSYKITDVELPKGEAAEYESCGYDRAVYKNGKLYGVRNSSHYYESTGDSAIKIEIVIVNTDGTVDSAIPVYSSESLTQGRADIQGLTVTDEGNISFVLRESITDPETYESFDKFTIKTVSPDGAEVGSLALEGILSEEESQNGLWLSGCIAGIDGNIYCCFNKCVKVLDSNGNLLFTTKPFDTNADMWIGSVFFTNEGIPAVTVSGYDAAAQTSSNKIVEIDLAAKDFGKEYPLPSYASGYSLYNGGGDYYAIYQGDIGLKGLKYDNASGSFTAQNVVDLLAVGIDTTVINSCTFSEDGTVAVLSSVNAGKRSVVSLCIPSEDADPSNKTSITLGCYNLDWYTRSAIAQFNKTSDKYVINAQSYTDTNDTQDYDTALTKFNNELLAGNIPDVILINEKMPVSSYESKGLFADIYEFIDNDASVSRDDLAQNVLTALESNEKLYTIGKGFQVRTLAARKDIVGDINTISISEARDFLSKMPEGSSIFAADQTSGDLLKWGIITGGFIDYDNGTCSFDSPEFKELLEFTKDYPAEIDYDKLYSEQPNFYEDMQLALYNGKILFNSVWLFNFEGGRMSIATMGDDVSFTGYPTTGANGGATIVLNTEMAVSSKSECKEGAWEFVKSVITHNTAEDGYFSSFPTYLPLLEEEKAQALKNAASDEGDNTFYMGGSEMKLDPVDQAYIDKITNAAYSVSVSDHFDAALMDIINEEVSAYYAGAKSVDETASIIQSRAGIFLSEQK